MQKKNAKLIATIACSVLLTATPPVAGGLLLYFLGLGHLVAAHTVEAAAIDTAAGVLISPAMCCVRACRKD